LQEYYAGSIEPSYLYLSNRFIQYAHARCLAEELEMLGVTGRKVPPGFINWPNGFSEIFDFSYVGSPSVRPRGFDSIHRIGGDQPHFGYPLRAVAEEAFFVRTGGGAGGPTRAVGNLSLQQAIREAYPGALYLHLAKGWKVQEWRATSFERAIRVTHGSLRLSEPLYDKLDLLIGRLRKAVDMTPEESDIIPEDLVAKIEEWQRGLRSDDTETFLSLLGAKQSADGWLQVYSTGSIVAKRDAQNILRDIEIVGTELVAIDGPSRLFYRYKVKNNVTALVSADSVEAVGDLWSMSYWNSSS
jgi:hypothetical protein